MSDPILDVTDLTVTYQDGGETVTAVSDANVTIQTGEYLGLVGESGSGKSTLAKSIIGALDDNGTIESGTIRYKGQDIQDMGTKELNREIRWKEISWIPQSSMNSLDPLKRISQQANELAKVHTNLTKAEIKERLSEAFEIVGLPPSRITDYPHEFSGGMNQRAIIALSIFLEPSLIIADEPTTALDVIMQDQIFRHLEELRDRDTTIMLITHDISLVFEFCDSISIMHAAQIAETGPVGELYTDPRHPYSILLQESFPDFHDTNKELSEISGYPPQLGPDPDFCSFAERCPWVDDVCYDGQPALECVSDDVVHTVACARKDEIDPENRPLQQTGELTDD
jgi:oligopeptide/dipeptide ABC transporter ATP-binding protein